MTRRCSHCSNNGHNSRTCPTTRGGGGGGGGGGVVKLFGVRLTDGSFMKKSKSMGNLSLCHHQSSATASASPNPCSPSSDHLRDGYLSDDPNHASCSSNRRTERKKGRLIDFQLVRDFDLVSFFFFFENEDWSLLYMSVRNFGLIIAWDCSWVFH